VLHLVNEGNIFNLGLIVVDFLKGQVDEVFLRLLLLELNQLLKSHIPGVPRQVLLLRTSEQIREDQGNFLVHLNDRLMVVVAHALNFLDGFPNNEIGVFAVLLVLFIFQCKEEEVVVFGHVVGLELDSLVAVVLLYSQVVVHPLLVLYNHEPTQVFSFKSEGQVSGLLVLLEGSFDVGGA